MHMYIHVCVDIDICIYTCIHIYIYIYIYICIPMFDVCVYRERDMCMHIVYYYVMVLYNAL